MCIFWGTKYKIDLHRACIFIVLCSDVLILRQDFSLVRLLILISENLSQKHEDLNSDTLHSKRKKSWVQKYPPVPRVLGNWVQKEFWNSLESEWSPVTEIHVKWNTVSRHMLENDKEKCQWPPNMCTPPAMNTWTCTYMHTSYSHM